MEIEMYDRAGTALDDGRVTLQLDDADQMGSVRRLHEAIDGHPDGLPRRYMLDLGNITGRKIHSRVDAKWGAAVTNLLMHDSCQLANVELIPPTEAAATTQLARAGLLFALARHRDLALTRDAEEYAGHFPRWKRDWVPTRPQLTLFDLGNDGTTPTDVADKVVAFLNPRSSRIEVNARRNAIYPWLQEFLGTAAQETTMEVLRDLSVITTELLDNVKEHAQSRNGLLTISQVSGDHKTRGKLQVVVVDSGQGMRSSIVGQGLSEDPEHYIAESLNGNLPPRAGGRGDGLAKITRKLKKYGGEIFLASGSGLKEQTLVIDHDFSDGNVVEPLSGGSDLGIKGTVIVVRIPHAAMTRNLSR